MYIKWILWLSFLSIFLFHSYEDYKTQLITFWPMILSYFIILSLNYQILLWYILYLSLYYLFYNFIHNHLGLGDIWYLVVFYYYNSLSLYILFYVCVFCMFYPQKKNSIPLLPCILITYLYSCVF
jgi:Flp pilus assembly protein protease CpaA